MTKQSVKTRINLLYKIAQATPLAGQAKPLAGQSKQLIDQWKNYMTNVASGKRPVVDFYNQLYSLMTPQVKTMWKEAGSFFNIDPNKLPANLKTISLAFQQMSDDSQKNLDALIIKYVNELNAKANKYLSVNVKTDLNSQQIIEIKKLLNNYFKGKQQVNMPTLEENSTLDQNTRYAIQLYKSMENLAVEAPDSEVLDDLRFNQVIGTKLTQQQEETISKEKAVSLNPQLEAIRKA